MLALGVDIGTTSISAVVVENMDKVLCSVTENSMANLATQNDWEMLQDAKHILDKVFQIIEGLEKRFPEVEAIGVTGQMHGIVYLDREGEIVSPLYTWLDGRGNLPFGENETYAQHITNVTQCEVATGMGFVTHFYNMRNGLVPANASVFCTIYDCLAMKLCAKKRPVIHPSSAASFGLFDVAKKVYRVDCLEKLGIQADMCPAVLENDGYVGETGRGVPVAVGLGDNQASYLGAVQDKETDVLVNIGTGSQVSFYVDKDCEAGQNFEIRPFIFGKYLMVGSSLNGGASFELLEKLFCEIAAIVNEREVQSCYSAIDDYLEKNCIPENIPTINTQFFGTRWNPEIHASMMNLTSDNFHALNLIYGFLYGMAEELHQMYLGYCAQNKVKFSRLIGSGNGIRKNPAMCKCLAAVFGMPITISRFEEEAACGAAFYAQMQQAR